MAEGGGFDHGTQTPEYKLLRSKFDRLVSGIAPDIGTVARKAFAKDLISPESKDEAHNQRMPLDGRANLVLELILRKVQSDTRYYYKFLAILSEIPSLKSFADELDFPDGKKSVASNLDYSDSGLASQMSTLSMSGLPQQQQELAVVSSSSSVSDRVSTPSDLLNQMPRLDSHVNGTSQEMVGPPLVSRLQRTKSEPSGALNAVAAGLKSDSASSNNSDDQGYLQPKIAEMPSPTQDAHERNEMSKSRESIQESQKSASSSSTLVYSGPVTTTPKNSDQILADSQAQMNSAFEHARKELRAEITMKNEEIRQQRQKIEELQQKLKKKKKEVVQIEQQKDAEIFTLKEQIKKLQVQIAAKEKEKDDMKKLHEEELSALADEHKENTKKLQKSFMEAIGEKEKVKQELILANRELEYKETEKKNEVFKMQIEVLQLEKKVEKLLRELHEKTYQLDAKEKEYMKAMHQKEIQLKEKDQELAAEKHEREIQNLKQQHQAAILEQQAKHQSEVEQHQAEIEQCEAEKEEFKEKHLAEKRRSVQLEERVQELQTQVSRSSSGQTLESQVSHSSRISMTSQMSEVSLEYIDEGDTG